MKCENCGKEAKHQCQTCEDWFCEDCLETPTYKNGLEETICENCYECRMEMRADYMEQEEKKEK